MKHMVAIPANTPLRECSSCHQPIFWILTGNGKRMPVSVDCEGGKTPTTEDPGLGISHFADCPNAAQHRKARA